MYTVSTIGVCWKPSHVSVTHNSECKIKQNFLTYYRLVLGLAVLSPV